MFRLPATALIAASLLAIFVAHAAARGRSFPIEVTGTITMFDKANHIFTIQSDKPPRALTIAVGRDCKFIQNGVPTGEWTLKKGARVRVSYFSTIFTGKIAVKIESNPIPEVKTGIIQKIEPIYKTFTLWLTEERRDLVVCGDSVSHYSAPFASNYALKQESEPGFLTLHNPNLYGLRRGR